MYEKGTRVYGRKGTRWERRYGLVMGTFTPCQLTCCRGVRVWVKWSNGKVTKPCSEGLVPEGDHLRIG